MKSQLYSAATILFLIGISVLPAEGLLCYSCGLKIGDDDRSCETDPSSIEGSSVECSGKYCITKRVEYEESKKGDPYLIRGCQDSTTPILNGSIEEEDGALAHYETCESDLCNKGYGRWTNNSVDEGKRYIHYRNIHNQMVHEK